MPKVVVIPDLHLQESLILPKIIETLDKVGESPDLFLFLGDYFDQWGISDLEFSSKQAEYLKIFSRKYPCKFLLGNHDIPYILYEPEHYSESNPEISKLYRKTLLDNLDSVYVAYEVGDFTFSHAGQIQGKFPSEAFNPINRESIEKEHNRNYLRLIQNGVSYSSGGNSENASCVWARPDDWKDVNYNNDNYALQIVGHTPMRNIKSVRPYEGGVTFADTFSLGLNFKNSKKHYYCFGNGNFMLIDTFERTIKKLSTFISDSELNEHFNLEGDK